MLYLAALFFAGFLYIQGKSLWKKQGWGEVAVFLLVTLTAAYYTLGQLLGLQVLNPADMIRMVLSPAIDYLFE